MTASRCGGRAWYHCAVLAALLVLSTWQITAEPAQPRVLVLDVRTDADALAGVQLGALLGNEIATVLGRGGQLEVLSSEDLRRLVDVAAGREATGCGDDASCLAELGAAMGARFVVSGTIGKVGAATIVQLSLFDVDRARSIARESGEAATADGVAATTRVLSERLRQALVPEEPTRLPVVPLVVAGSGGLIAFGGVVAAVVAYPIVVDTTLPSAGGPDPANRQAAQLVGAVGVVTASAGVVAVGAGALLYVLGVGE
ncbi:MAG: hypothetical protein HYS27_18955 [Deltaproteobacteria bacterium]|nr:hypothetical protein [Deltaproteobacteria bacterium]